MDIVEEIGMPAMLGQLAEECAELGKAALKLQRILMGTNPTPVTEDQAVAELTEEAADVQLCIALMALYGGETINRHRMDHIMDEKFDRWCERILEAKSVKNEVADK